MGKYFQWPHPLGLFLPKSVSGVPPITRGSHLLRPPTSHDPVPGQILNSSMHFPSRHCAENSIQLAPALAISNSGEEEGYQGRSHFPGPSQVGSHWTRKGHSIQLLGWARRLEGIVVSAEEQESA